MPTNGNCNPYRPQERRYSAAQPPQSVLLDDKHYYLHHGANIQHKGQWHPNQDFPCIKPGAQVGLDT
ncbi:hypothetical protein BFJ70_g4528 [Fusarium oxysporum]|uniref:Uncharacterized protein n=2 Tax=Fusarium oxysporum TaxID=5507 RepID=A0A420PZ82_FUSOX|nr:hypothetical protein H9L39_15802 [Fusarium oxysporum f. sp. albedinis]RKK92017.1 hypothetical protein BFJ71_g10492 [Fusarium oxysporum]RKK97832.1 hypothetical protein BFJ68_g13890 [Fusarium oxysporum]RKL42830.1 hypothetical protein BFJ70_g4528 [Fusarium oxysporum]